MLCRCQGRNRPPGGLREKNLRLTCMCRTPVLCSPLASGGSTNPDRKNRRVGHWPTSEDLHGHPPKLPCNEYRRYFVAGLMVCADAQNNGLRGSRLGFLTN